MGKGLFGTLSQNTVNYLKAEIQSLASNTSEYSKQLYERSLALFDQVNSEKANLLAEAVLSQVDSMMGLDIIEPLLTIDLLQAAKPIMQNWIMTNPVIRQAMYDGKLEGYSDTYKDPEPGLVGHEMEAYRFLMNGVVVEHETQSGQYSLYYDREHNADTQLTMRKLSAIVETQEAAVQAYLQGDRDPTSQYDASL